MMKRVFLIATLIGAALMSQAEINHYCLNVGDFNELKVIDGINVEYYCSADSAGYAVFDTDPEVVSKLIFSNDKSKLKIQVADDYNPQLASKKLPKITIYSQYLSAVENSSDSTVRVLTVAPGAKLQARVIGNGHIVVRDVKATQVDASLDTGSGSVTINGVCHTAKLNLTGTGTIQADGLEAQDVRIRAFGTGSVGCWATDALTVYGMGTAKIYYRGKPEKIKKRAVSIKMFPLDEE